VHERFGVFATGYPITVAESELAVHLRLDPATVARKLAALTAQQTQTAGLIAALGVSDYAAWISAEGFVAECPSCWWNVTAACWRCSRWHPSRS
jgi:hypothetical protein